MNAIETGIERLVIIEFRLLNENWERVKEYAEKANV